MEKELSLLSLDGDASTGEIRNAYIKITANKKFSRLLTEDPVTRAEFISVYQAYVTLMKHRAETDSHNNRDLYPPEQLFQIIFNQGVYLVLTQQWIKAGEKLQQAYTLNKNHSLLQTYLGLILLKRKNEYAAEKYLLRAIDISANNADAWLLLGDVYYQTGNFKKAQTMYQSVLDLTGSNPVIQKRLVQLKQKEAHRELGSDTLVDKIKKIFG